MIFDPKTLILKKYYLGSPEQPSFFTTTFHNFRKNQHLTERDFIYHPPKGIHAIDITHDLLSHINEQ